MANPRHLVESNGDSRDTQTGRAATSTSQTIPAATVITPVMAGAPCRRRSLWLVVVPRCPHCGYMHSHRSGSARLFAGTAERVCPQTGRAYLLAVGGGRR